MTRLRKVLFAVLIAAGVIGFVEAAFSIYYYVAIDEEERERLEVTIGLQTSEKYTAIRFIPHPYFNYICNPDYVYPSGYAPHNSRGFRKPEWPTEKEPGTARIVAVGGSTTYGMHFERTEEIWPALLAGELQSRLGSKIEVFNLGVPNYTPHEVLGVMAMLMPTLEPDLVLIHLGANNAYTAAYPAEGGPANTTFRFSWTHRPPPKLLAASMRRSYAIRVAGHRWLARNGFALGEMSPSMQYPRPDGPTAEANARSATGKHFRQAMSGLVALARNIGAEPVLVDQPLDPRWDEPRDRFLRVVVTAHRRNNRILAELGREHDVLVIGLYERMRQQAWFNDALHASRAGMSVKAQLVADDLEPVVRRLLSEVDAAADPES